jgi:hypothetical protein
MKHLTPGGEPHCEVDRERARVEIVISRIEGSK